jgi:hypothetical protein
MTDTDVATDWYRRPGVLVAFALGVLGVSVGVGLALAAIGGDDDQVDATAATVTTVPTTLPPPPTVAPVTSPPALALCEAGDQEACDELDDEVLEELCFGRDDDDRNEDACQVLLARQGDGDAGDDEDRYGDDDRGRGNDRDDDDDDDDD